MEKDFCSHPYLTEILLCRTKSCRTISIQPELQKDSRRSHHEAKHDILQTRQNSIIRELPQSSSVIDAGFLFQYLSHIPPHWAAMNLFASWWLEWVHYPLTSFTEVFSPKVLEPQHFYMFASSIYSPKWTEGNRTTPNLMLLTAEKQFHTWNKVGVKCADCFLPLTVEGSTNTAGRFKGNWEKQGKADQTLSFYPLLTLWSLKSYSVKNNSFLRKHLFVCIRLR